MLSTLAPALASASQPGGLPVDSLNWPKADLTQVSPAEYLLTTLITPVQHRLARLK